MKNFVREIYSVYSTLNILPSLILQQFLMASGSLGGCKGGVYKGGHEGARFGGCCSGAKGRPAFAVCKIKSALVIYVELT